MSQAFQIWKELGKYVTVNMSVEEVGGGGAMCLAFPPSIQMFPPSFSLVNYLKDRHRHLKIRAQDCVCVFSLIQNNSFMKLN
jgi:hypothetical protein